MDKISPPIVVKNVWKEFHLGSEHDSLRDVVGNFLKKAVGRSVAEEEKNEHAGKFWALKDVSFDVKKGESVGIIGHNGAGKSTALKLLSRICRQTRGEIKVKGRVAALIEVGAGFHPDLTGRENIFLNGTVMGLTHKEIRKAFDSIVAYAELEKFLDMPVKRYSSGMTVRLGFAVVAHVFPDVMLIDEVLAVGDMAFQQKCYQRILELKAKGTTILFVSHNLEAISRLCDRVVLLREGQVVMDGDPAKAIALYRDQTLTKTRFEKVWTPLGVEIFDTTREIHFSGARLENTVDNGKEDFQSGDGLRVSVSFSAKRKISNASITMTVERMDGLVCHEASTRVSGVSLDIEPGETTVVLEYPTLNLSANNYLITAALHEGQNPVALAQLPEPLYFKVTSDGVTRGAMQLEHEWTVGAVEHVQS